MAGRPKKKPHLINGVPYWRCSSCGDYKPAKRFPPSKDTSAGISSWCHDCHSGRGRPKATICNVKGCDGAVRAREMCCKHYQRWHRCFTGMTS